VPFRFGMLMKVYGVCKFLLLGTEPHFELYVTPINIDPENVRVNDERRAIAELNQTAVSRRIQSTRNQHSATKSGGVGKLHQRRRSRFARHFRFHPSPSRGKVQAGLLRFGNIAGVRLGNWGVQFATQVAENRSQAAGRSVLGLPGCERRSNDLLRPALQLPTQPVAAWTPSLSLRYGHNGHARHGGNLPALLGTLPAGAD